VNRPDHHTPSRASRARYREYITRRRAAENEQRVDLRESPDANTRQKRTRSLGNLIRSFWGLLTGHRKTMLFALGTLTVSTLLGMALPVSSKIAIDYILTDNPGPSGLAAFGVPESWLPTLETEVDSPLRGRLPLLLALSGALMTLVILSAAIGTWGRYQTTRLTKRLQASLRRRVFGHAVRLPLGRVYQIKSGGVASILREDAGGAAELLFSLIYNPWRAVIQVVLALGVLALVDWRLLVGGLGVLPIVWYSHRAWIGGIRPIWRDIRTTRTGIDGQSTEVFGGMRVVRGFGREHAESSRFVTANHLLIRQEMLAWWRSRLLEILWMVMIPFGSVLVLLYGGWQILSGNLTVGDMVMLSGYLLMLLGPIEALVSSATSMQNNLAGLDKTLDLLDEPAEFAESTPTVALERPRVRGHITMRDVRFAYPKPKSSKSQGGEEQADQTDQGDTSDQSPTPPTSREVIRGVSLDAPAGTTTAFVGPSGSGKTTLCNLIGRFFDPTSGSITLDGTDLRDIDVTTFRRVLGIVEQDVFLFDGTIAENIGYARRDATQADIIAAAEAAAAHTFITELENGYDTLVGERGVRLSGGQKQRIAIARAVLADPAILILDEATSNLDSESEALIQRGLLELSRGRTTFVIAHRLSTIRRADQIVVVDRGEIIERGTHDELTNRGGRYADLLKAQLEPEPTTTH
jgi:ATP-binding cassette subfamily B protein